MVKALSTLSKETEELIAKCVSSSGVCGRPLREAHYRLGAVMGRQIQSDFALRKKSVAVLIMMRAGLPFGLGIADQLEIDCNVDVLFSTADNDYSSYDYVIIADAVINTGKTVFEVIKQMNRSKVIIATNVIAEKYISNFDGLTAYAVRISVNSFKGAKTTAVADGKGPDTGDRLFNNSFYNGGKL